MNQTPMKLLVVDLEYPRSEINEPINVDTILDCLSQEVLSLYSPTVWYRTLGETISHPPAHYDLILISTKVASAAALAEVMAACHSKPVIIGGMLATFAQDFLLQQYPNAILSRGECEENLDMILRFFAETSSLVKTRDLLYAHRTNGVAFTLRDGSVYASPIRPVNIQKIERPLSHRSVERVLARGGLVRIEGSRGCPWNRCRFCCVDYRYGNGIWRAFPIDRTLKEIEMLSRKGAGCIYFTDEDFVGNPTYFFSLFAEIAARKASGHLPEELEFWGSTSVYTLMRFGEKGLSDFLILAKQCGISVLFLGIESGCDAQLVRYNKGVTKADNLRILRALFDGGISTDVGFILFDAETTLEEVAQNLQFCRESGLSNTVSRLAKSMRVIPHTKLAAHYAENGWLVEDPDPNELTCAYHFRDPKVALLFESLQRFGAVAEEAAHNMQAEIRMQGSYTDPKSTDPLLFFRNTEYQFIEAFLARFAYGEVHRDAAEELTREYIRRLTAPQA